MIYSLNAIEKNGFEGTLVGTLVMPYFSGFPNLCFAWFVAQKGSEKTKVLGNCIVNDGSLVLENCLVNNVTTLTLVLAIPSILWGLHLFKNKKITSEDQKINRLSLQLSLLALIFFSSAICVVSYDGAITSLDGMLLVGIFLFWQLFHVFDLLKNKTRKKAKIQMRFWLDLCIIGICAWGIFTSIEGLIDLVSARETGFFSKRYLGFLSGALMVLPNACLALYYSAVNRSDIAYSSQIGDCHICIPLCIGLFTIFTPIMVTPSSQLIIYILIGAAGLHFLFITLSGRLPRMVGIVLTGLYAFFLIKGIF